MMSMRLLPLAGVSLLTLGTALHAQEANDKNTTVLDTITIIGEGDDNVEATGGTVVTQEDLEKLRPTDVSELFSRESSVTVSGGGGPSKRIHVLGMEQSNLAVTVDGVPQTATSWHHTGSSMIDPVFLKRVEVEAGAAAADSGFGAAAGAVRYETVGALDLLEDGRNFGGRIGASYGTNGKGFSGNVAGYGRHEGFDWFLMGHGVAGGGNYESGSGLEILGTEPAARNILAKLGYEANGHRVDLGYERGRDEADRLIKMNMGLAGDELHPLEVSRDSVNLKYTTTEATDYWDPEIAVYYTQNDYWRNNYAARTNGNMNLNEDLFGGKAQNTFTMAYGKITAGFDVGQHNYHTDNYGNNNRQYRDFDTLQTGAFVQGRFEFDNSFKVSTGARLDHHRFTDWDDNAFSGSGASANVTVAYAINENIEVFAGASSTWLGYVVGDYGYVHARTDAFYTDPDFEPGRAQNLKVGANFGYGDWRGGVTVFDTRINGLPEYTTAVLQNYADEFRSRGVTLNTSYRWGETSIGATYTYADVTQGANAALPNSGTFMPVGHMATAFIDHEFVDYNLKVGASLSWASRIADAYATSNGFLDQPSYTVVNAYAEWNPPINENLTLRVGVENLFNETYYERSSYAASTSRGGIDPVYAPGRTFTFQTALKF
ncbi:MAG TPA: TonB-dependent receptor [Mesorhizobium sp.]|nr:TonB-dependent receptor [Mesorhizobium sp.]